MNNYIKILWLMSFPFFPSCRAEVKQVWKPEIESIQKIPEAKGGIKTESDNFFNQTWIKEDKKSGVKILDAIEKKLLSLRWQKANPPLQDEEGEWKNFINQWAKNAKLHRMQYYTNPQKNDFLILVVHTEEKDKLHTVSFIIVSKDEKK